MKNFTCKCCGKSCFDHRAGVCFSCGMAGAYANRAKSCDYCKTDGPPVCPEHDVTDCQLMSHRAAGLLFWAEHGPRLEAYRRKSEESS